MIEILKGDITRVTSEAIVNAANSSLMGGGGVDGAIHRAGGPAILADCRAIVEQYGGLPIGHAVITTAGNLPARFVIHTVGPVWNGGVYGEAGLLADCYRNSLLLATQYKCGSIAFPNISTGIYGFPKDQAAAIAVRTVLEFTAMIDTVYRVTFVCYDDENLRLIREQYALQRRQ